jgi:hypothetical protein
MCDVGFLYEWCAAAPARLLGAMLVQRTMTAGLALLAALTAAAVVPATAAASAPAPYSPRPHADFALRDDGLRVARFDVSARPRGDRVLVSVTMTARSRAKDVRTVLRIGACTGGPQTSLNCQPTVNRLVVLHPGSTTITHLNGRVRRPVRTNAIRVTLTRPGQVVHPPRSPFVGIVDMVLPASAWTTFADRAFGVRVARPWEGDRLPYELTALTAGSAQIDRDRLRTTMAWTAAGLAPGAIVTTTVGRCPAACPLSWQEVTNQIGRVGFGERPFLRRTDDRQVLDLAARGPDGNLFSLVMPWPR